MTHTQNNAGANIDPQEIAKFEELASRWWDRDSEFKPLHDINPLRVDFIDRIASLSGKKVLDVGCGGGILSEAMAHRGAEVTGIDMGEAPLKVAKLHGLESGVSVTYRQVTVEELATEQPESYDIVTCMEMMEHVPDPSSIVDACSRLVKPGGYVIFSTLNRNPKSYMMAIVGAEYLLKLVPKGTHDFNKFIRPSELASWIRQSGLNSEKITGLTYNPLSKSYKLNDRDVDVNYMVATRKPG
ncbi:bifunctional 2-polyprenyl-6-hydroxyphenol methylase/3-demethylubiquinol 3-O-methyltransferase UbiG [Amphritea sp. 2_MG-2023]|uniref:bifunctional 2-polyprenyl-6-hydroxyphenol methylase/3-demethylubiquinol 3-O-methyltransferase UbiG n=1 Tax=Amphritea TaxID=515417 RepID=UPI001C07365F|nr:MULTISPECIES: bifunctional 2-polyprenyl-6-hydroxyphenol methylase/3-demethylubiquinol 3-O-methyltransferase UbiG [Amphritea]MBU2965116.1 bifunctional 2-polyprenyl-6-hydroxyphenol methylase/3-demethylubiquinol 3-O-methyltransferase UbiG [Amphritea atlantica]MDO6418901.1 bifunctional 2-polyprenyl-6-hydroxyphenol methylase/3-demethylubiquinol 3-O-methyltransferase UbiG [Amphritea sp. 2_MG-2023]